MTDIRLAAAAYLTGVRIDWLIRQEKLDAVQYVPAEYAWPYYGGRHFGTSYFGRSYFNPRGRRLQHYFSQRSTGTLDDTEELRTAALVALGTDKLSDVGEILPDPDSTDRRGWWGDMDAEEIWGGWAIGCRNWLLLRAKITSAASIEGSTVERARTYTQEALQPFIDHRIASSISVNAERADIDRIVVNAVMYRGPLSEIDLRFQLMWSEIKP